MKQKSLTVVSGILGAAVFYVIYAAICGFIPSVIALIHSVYATFEFHEFKKKAGFHTTMAVSSWATIPILLPGTTMLLEPLSQTNTGLDITGYIYSDLDLTLPFILLLAGIILSWIIGAMLKQNEYYFNED